MVYSEPALWEAAKRAARERLGGHSARAMQLAGQLYRAAGGRYLGRKSKAQQSLTTWTRQNWTTKSGKPSRETGERYLPRRVIEQLSSAEYAATTRAKRQGTKQGKQYVKQPAAIAAKVARLKAQANPKENPTMKPKLKHYEGSYAVVSLETGKAVAELDKNSELLDKINTRKYKLVPIGAYLAGLNRKENPTMKRKPTPAQIAARERFAAMARSGAFKKKAAKAKKATDDTRTVSQKLKEYAINNAILERVESGQSVKSAYDAVLGKGAYERLAGELYDEIRKTKSNPAKKTVSQKISQLTREGYPQKQAVAIALNEERAGKVKRNPITETLIYGLAPGETRDYMEDLLYDGGLKLTQAQIDQVLKAASAAGYHSFRIAGFDPTVKPDFTKALKTGRKRNPRASNPIILVSDKAIATKRKRNPQSPTVTHKGARNIAYAVQAKRMLAGGGAQFETVAGFPTKAQAQDYIDALLKTYPKGLTLRISAA